MNRNFFLINFFVCFLYSEVKNLQNLFIKLKWNLKKVNYLKYFLYHFNKNINPIKSKSLNNFLVTNQRKWKTLEKKINHKKNKVLVECFINHEVYNLSNILIGKFLQKIYNCDAVAILRSGDLKNEIILKSFGIKKIYFYNFGDFFNRAKYIFKACKIAHKLKNTKDLYNFKLEGIDMGLTAYDTWIRYSRIPNATKINIKMIYFLANALHSKDFFEKILLSENIKNLVQAEKQFVPLSILFQTSLKNNVKIYSRDGFNKITTRIYSQFKQRHDTKIKFSTKMLQNIMNNLGSVKITKMFNNYYNFQFKNKIFGKSWAHQVQHKRTINTWKKKVDGNEDLNNKKLLSIKDLEYFKKKDICNKFYWDQNKKIVTVFFPYLIDGIYQNGRRKLYIDNYLWIKNTLNIIQNSKKCNWILREHPQERRYNSITDLNSIIDELIKKNNHIKLSPYNINPVSLINITDVAVTCNGTAGLEYQSFGKPVLVAENSYYSHFGFKNVPKNKSHYKNLLKNITFLKKPTKKEILKAKSILLSTFLVSKTDCSFIPDSKPIYETRMNDHAQELFWKELKKKMITSNVNKDLYYKMFVKQIEFQNRHTINFKKYYFKNQKISDFF